MMLIPNTVEPLTMTFNFGVLPFVIATVAVLVGLIAVLSVALADRRALNQPTPPAAVKRLTARPKVATLPVRERSLAA